MAVMLDQEGETYAFGFQAVREKVPSASGVYRLFTARQWVYVGQSDDIRQSLLQHLNQPDSCTGRSGPLSFSFETAAPGDRVSRQQALVAELAPSCNRTAN